jgi:hypothetical protein
VWEEEEIHCNARTYYDVTLQETGRPLGRIVDEEKAWEKAREKVEEEATKKSYVATTSA